MQNGKAEFEDCTREIERRLERLGRVVGRLNVASSEVADRIRLSRDTAERAARMASCPIWSAPSYSRT